MNYISNLIVNKSILEHINYTKIQYSEYVDKIFNLTDEQRETFLRTIILDELVNNQSMDNADEFLIKYKMFYSENPIEFMKKSFQRKGGITLESINQIHTRLIEDTETDKESNRRFRDGTDPNDDNRWVGYVNPITGERKINYFPLESSQVIKVMEEIVKYANSDSDQSIYGNLFLKPIILHGLISVIQPFGDGNTRTARLIQYGQLWFQTNKSYEKNFKTPILFLSDRYKAQYPSYREYIARIANDKDSDAWNNWFDFNLNMIDEKLYSNGNELEKVKKF